MDRVTNIAWRTTGGATLGGFEYEYDAVGRIVSRSHALGDQSHPSQMSQSSQKSYSYDDLDRLSSDGGATYTYDAAGNRMTRTKDGVIVTYTLGVGDRLASWSGGAYTYDIAGNVTRIERTGRPTLDLTWNGQYQLASVSTNGVFAESYAYDALGRRVSTTTAEGTTCHVYDDKWQVVADLDANGNVAVSYVWGEGIDNLLAVSVGGASYYPLTDIQGTVWGYVDESNSVVARWLYDAWGYVVDEDVSIPALVSLRYRFQCREWSAATGLVNFRMRWYDSETGRWLSKDPIGIEGGFNLYILCCDSPMSMCDPLGTSPLVFMVRPNMFPRFLLEDSPKIFPRNLPKSPPKIRPGWKPSDGIPEGFKPPSPSTGGKGNYHCPDTHESLHPDMEHGPPQGPHWDYVDQFKQHWRISPDGTWSPKLIFLDAAPTNVPRQVLNSFDFT